jgi:uncharacterized membrane protein AbrB (regulator of aidB expression)
LDNWLYVGQLAIRWTIGYSLDNWLYVGQLAIRSTIGYSLDNWLYVGQLAICWTINTQITGGMAREIKMLIMTVFVSPLSFIHDKGMQHVQT